MGVGLDQMLNKVSSSSSRAEDEEELGEYSDHHDSNCSSSDEDSPASPPNRSSTCHVPPASQLPIKRGLSKFYEGKSQSFSSFSDVRCVEDLAKKAHPIRRKMMKPSMSYGDGLLHVETSNSCCDGKSMMDDQNKVPRVSSCASSIARTSTARNCKPPPIPMHK